MQAGLAVLTPDTLDAAAIETVREQALALSDVLAMTYFR